MTFAEGELVVVCDLSNGPYRKRTGLTGIEPPNRLYTPLDADGRPIVVPEEGLVLTRKLADILHVREGSVIEVRPLIGRRTRTRAVVVSLVDTYLGLPAYARASYLSRLIGEERVTNVLLLRAPPGPRGARFSRRRRLSECSSRSAAGRGRSSSSTRRWANRSGRLSRS